MSKSIANQFAEFIKQKRANPQVSVEVKAKPTMQPQEPVPEAVTTKLQPKALEFYTNKQNDIPKYLTEDERRELQKKTMEEFDKLFGTTTK